MSNPRILLIFLVVISCIVILFKTNSSTSFISNTDEIKQTGISNKDVESITKNSISEIGEEMNQQHRLPNIIFSCFYFRSDFYSGRKVPSLDWIIVMIESAFEHRFATSNSISSSSKKRDTTKLVMFVDANTKERLEKFIVEREKEKKRENFFKNQFLELVLIDEENDAAVKELFSQNRWADSTKLKNAANNFRFWFIQRYMKNILLEQNHRSSQLSSMKIAIVDATDVLFQRNPFIDDGTCFPQHHQRPPSFAPSYFLFTLEDASKNFNNEIYNKRWMKCYDSIPQEKSPLAEMGKIRMRISCAGVSLGSFYGVLTYLQVQLAEISKPSLTECAISGVKAALDQATHNYLMYAGVFSPSTNRKDDSWRNAFGEVINKTKETEKQELFVAALPHHQIRRSIQKFGKGMFWNSFISENGKTETTSSSILKWNDKSDCVFHGNFGKLNMDGDKVVVGVGGGGSKIEYAIVHQYTSDRHPKVMKVARNKYDV